MKKIILFSVSFLAFLGTFAKSALDGKKVVFIGNSFIYYGGCVLNGNQRHLDEGMFAAICKQNGDHTEVYDCTYGGHHIDDFTDAGCISPSLHKKGRSGHCDGVGTQLLDSVPLQDIDVVFFSEAGENNKNIIADLKSVMKRFTNPKTRFFYLVHTYTYYKQHRAILDNLSAMQQIGITIVPWGEVAYNLTQGIGTIPGSKLVYTPQSFIKNKGDVHHPNPLGGYITAQMAYCAATGKSAVGQKYNFVEKLMPTKDFLARHYKQRSDTDYPEILHSKKDMKGIQELIDKCLTLSLPKWKDGVDGSHNYKKFALQAQKEYLEPIRPGYEGKNPFWNGYARKFIYAPSFDFKFCQGAGKYRFILYQDSTVSYKWTTPVQQRPDDKLHEDVPTDCTAGFLTDIDIHAPSVKTWQFEAKSPQANLAPIWMELPVGHTKLVVEALDAQGKVLQKVGERLFTRDFPFEPPYAEAPRSYREAALKAMLYNHNMPAIQAWKKATNPDLSYKHNTYPCKIIGSTIRMEVRLARELPLHKEECLLIARNAAQFLMENAPKDGSPLAYFPPTYYKGLVASARAENQGTTLVMEAATPAQAYLDLYDVTGEERYKTEALNIARTYMHLQREDGSFPVKVYVETGKSTGDSNAMLHPLLRFLLRLKQQYGIDTFESMRQKGEKWMHEVAVGSFEMKGQFEDVTVAGWKPYQNLTNSTSGPYASYLLHKDKITKEDMQDATDLIHFCEDQFVHWNALPNADGIRQIQTPGVYEQYEYRVPVDNSACNVANALLDYYENTGDELAFQKAKALADAIVVVQNPVNGQIITTWDYRSYSHDAKRAYWLNCSLGSSELLLRMAGMKR